MNSVSRYVTLFVLCSVGFSTQQNTGNIIQISNSEYLDELESYITESKNAGVNPHKITTDCKRECNASERRICYHNFLMEDYAAMGPACKDCGLENHDDCFGDQCIMVDGVERGVKSVNRMIPGPHIETCKNDLIVIDVTNAMAGSGASLHWHGMLQHGSQYMDGVPFVTQCPIQDNNAFRYKFWATDVGTHFWHSHSGHHKADGHYGGLTVRGPANDDPNRALYDVDDNVIIVSDWQHDLSGMFDPGLPTRKPGALPVTFLVNGKGKYRYTDSGVTTVTPYELLHVETGKRYRFRLVNAASHVCPIQIQVQDHNMTVIATDGYDIRPRIVDSIVTYAGERYDVIINADKEDGMFWFTFKGLAMCKQQKVYQVAMMVYNQDPAIKWMHARRTRPNYEDIPDGLMLNHPNITVNSNVLKVTDLEAWNIDQSVVFGKPDVRIVSGFSNKVSNIDTLLYGKEWPHFLNNNGHNMMVGTVDKISTTFPPSPYLSQYGDIDNSTLCNDQNLPERCQNMSSHFCVCNHLKKIPLNAVVEMILVDESTAITNINHPMHLHGHAFYVLKMGQGINGTRLSKDFVETMQGSEFQLADNTSAPLKDTISVPSFGYAVIRFRADNPGFWLWHCHFDAHMLIGMLMTFQVGETSDYHPPPKDFPTCGHFK